MASCVDPGILGDSEQALIPIVLVPGSGVGAVQGTVNWNAPDEMRSLLQSGVSAQETLDFLISDAFETDPNQGNQVRQYGAVSFEPGLQFGSDTNDSEQSVTGEASVPVGDLSAVFTGEVVEAERHAVAGKNVAAQGLLLQDEAVINDALSAYAATVDGSASSSQLLEQALVNALVAGAEAGGDSRCSDQTALFAHLAVAEPGDEPLDPSTLLTVTVDEGDGQNPVLLMAEAYEQGQRGWIDAGQRSSAGVSKVWAAVVACLVGLVGVFLVRKGMGNTAARR